MKLSYLSGQMGTCIKLVAGRIHAHRVPNIQRFIAHANSVTHARQQYTHTTGCW